MLEYQQKFNKYICIYNFLDYKLFGDINLFNNIIK